MTQRQPGRVPTNGPDKNDAVRRYLNDHPDASDDEIVAGLADEGIRVSHDTIQSVRETMEAAE